MSGLLQAFFRIAPLELFRTLALNRESFMTESHLYSSIKKNFISAFCWQAEALTKIWTRFKREGEAQQPLALCPLCCGGRAQHRPHPTQWRAELQGGGREKLPFSPFLVSLSWKDAVPLLTLPWEILSLHPTALAGMSPHVAPGMLISASVGSMILYLDLQPLVQARKTLRDLWGFTEISFLWSWGPQFLHYTIVFIQAAFPWCNLSTHVSLLQKIYSSGKSRDWCCSFSMRNSHTYSH